MVESEANVVETLLYFEAVVGTVVRAVVVADSCAKTLILLDAEIISVSITVTNKETALAMLKLRMSCCLFLFNFERSTATAQSKIVTKNHTLPIGLCE